jgi:hypothetical protein
MAASASAEPDWSLLAAVARIILELTNKLMRDPNLSRADAMQFVKEHAPGQVILFRGLLWPQARLAAGLAPRGKPGRPRKWPWRVPPAEAA